MKKLLILFVLSILISQNANSQVGWYTLSAGPPFRLSSVYFSSANIGYAVGDAGLIIKTSNAGINWVTQNAGDTATLNAVYFINDNTGFAVGNNGLYRRTTNGGTTWVYQNLGYSNSLNDIMFPSASTGYIVGNAGLIMKSTSTGSSWGNQTSYTSQNLYSTYFRSTDTGYVAGVNTFLKTSNGSTWNVVNPGFTSSFNSLTMPNISTIYMAGSNGMIIKSTNIGTSWVALSPPVVSSFIFNKIVFSSVNTGYATGDAGTIIKTTNAGINWSVQTSGTANVLNGLYFLNDNTGYAVGNNGIILKTTNGGQMFPVISVIYPANNSINIPLSLTFIWTKGNEKLDIFSPQLLISKYWFELVRDTSTMLGLNRDTTLIDTTKLVSGLLKNTNYFWRVKGKNELGWGAFTIWNKFTSVPNQPPVAVLNNVYRPNEGRVVFSNITLSDSLSYDPDGYLDTSKWYINGSLISTQHSMTYSFPLGTTLVKLIVKDNEGAKDSVVAKVTRIAFKKYTNGQVYAGESMLGDSIFYVISSGDAAYRLDINGNTIYTLTVGGTILSSCSIAYDSTVFIASSNNYIYGFSKTGSPLWTPVSLSAPASSTPTIDSIGNRLYVGVGNGDFFCINKSSGGAPLWSYALNSPVKSCAVISRSRKLVVPSCSGTIYGFNLNLPSPSPPSWILNLNDSILVSPAIDTSGYFYFGSRSGKVYKVSLTGSTNSSVVWQTPIGSPVTSSPTIDINGNIYVGTANGNLYSLNKNGGIRWNFTTAAQIKSTATITKIERIYFGNDAGEIYGLDTNKTVKFYYVDSSKISCAMLYKNGTIYFGNEAGRLFALYDSTGGSYEKSGIGGPAWGTFQNNVRRTGNQTDGNQTIGIQKITSIVPDKYELFQNYPNPFNPVTTIKFSIPALSFPHVLSGNPLATLKIYDVLGRLIKTLVNEKLEAGEYEVQFNSTEFSSGVYFYRFTAGSFNDSKKMLLIK